MIKRNLLLAALLAASGTAAAEDGPHSFAWTAWATTDYVFRGVSQNDEHFTLQGAFDYSHESGFYAGAWISKVDFGDAGPNAELDTYLGFSFPIGETLKGDVQLLRYNYIGGNNGSDFEYNELIAKLTYADFITGTIGYSNDVFATGETGIYYALQAKHAWESGFTLFGGAGFYDLNDAYAAADGYVDWNLGVSQTFGPVEVALTYTDTDSDGSDLFGDIAGNRVFLSAKVGF
jgi:uncharacterized protein (TIGR02001 family)